MSDTTPGMGVFTQYRVQNMRTTDTRGKQVWWFPAEGYGDRIDLTEQEAVEIAVAATDKGEVVRVVKLTTAVEVKVVWPSADAVSDDDLRRIVEVLKN